MLVWPVGMSMGGIFEVLSILGWPVGMSMGDCINELVDIERLFLLWVTQFPRQGILNYIDMEKLS